MDSAAGCDSARDSLIDCRLLTTNREGGVSRRQRVTCHPFPVAPNHLHPCHCRLSSCYESSLPIPFKVGCHESKLRERPSGTFCPFWRRLGGLYNHPVRSGLTLFVVHYLANPSASSPQADDRLYRPQWLYGLLSSDDMFCGGRTFFSVHPIESTNSTRNSQPPISPALSVSVHHRHPPCHTYPAESSIRWSASLSICQTSDEPTKPWRC